MKEGLYMAVNSYLENLSIIIHLNNGIYSQSNIKTVCVPLGNLNPANYDPQKVLNIVEALAPCFMKSIYKVQEVRTSYLED